MISKFVFFHTMNCRYKFVYVFFILYWRTNETLQNIDVVLSTVQNEKFKFSYMNVMLNL